MRSRPSQAWLEEHRSAGAGQHLRASRPHHAHAWLTLDVDDHHLRYASYTSICKPQHDRDRSGRSIAPLEGNSYEVGAKGEYLGGKLNAALVLFRIQHDNLAVNDIGQLVPGTTDQAYIAANGTVRQGVEFQLDGQLFEQWRIAFGFAKFDANDASGVDVNPTSPRREATVFTSWQTGPWRVCGGLSWQSAIHELMPGAQNSTVRLTQGSVLLANAMARATSTRHGRRSSTCTICSIAPTPPTSCSKAS